MWGDKGLSEEQMEECEVKDQSPVEDIYPIVIRSLSGKSVCILIRDSYTTQEVKSRFQGRELLAMEEVDIYFEGKILKDTNPISKYNIGRNSTLYLTLRLRGGDARKGASTSSKPSFREVVDKRSIQVQLAKPKPTKYIVEQSKQSPCVEMVDPTIQDIYLEYFARAIIYKFNGFWLET